MAKFSKIQAPPATDVQRDGGGVAPVIAAQPEGVSGTATPSTTFAMQEPISEMPRSMVDRNNYGYLRVFNKEWSECAPGEKPVRLTDSIDFDNLSPDKMTDEDKYRVYGDIFRERGQLSRIMFSRPKKQYSNFF